MLKRLQALMRMGDSDKIKPDEPIPAGEAFTVKATFWPQGGGPAVVGTLRNSVFVADLGGEDLAARGGQI